MKELIVNDSLKRLSLDSGNLIVKNQEREIELTIALNQVQRVLLYGSPQVTTQLVKTMAKEGVELLYFDRHGKYLGYLDSLKMENYEKQKEQFTALSQSDFEAAMARKILTAKIKGQEHLLRAFDQDALLDQGDYAHFRDAMEGIGSAVTINEMIGFEGRAAKSYFYCLNLLVPSDFRFHRRSKNPPLDPFNALLSFGYSVLYGRAVSALKKRGLNVGFGCIHRVKQHHAALASDLMEVWRPLIVDEVVMRLLKNKQMTTEQFDTNPGKAVMMNKEARVQFYRELCLRMEEKHLYIQSFGKEVTFDYALELQVESLLRAFHKLDPAEFIAIGDSLYD